MKNEMTPRGWFRKFQLAFSGLFWAIGTERSFSIHLPAAIVAISTAQFLRFEMGRWIALLLTIGIVLVAELFNTALESLARAVDERPNEHIKRALDVASAAVLVSSIMAIVVGVLLFWTPFWYWYSIAMSGGEVP